MAIHGKHCGVCDAPLCRSATLHHPVTWPTRHAGTALSNDRTAVRKIDGRALGKLNSGSIQFKHRRTGQRNASSKLMKSRIQNDVAAGSNQTQMYARSYTSESHSVVINRFRKSCSHDWYGSIGKRIIRNVRQILDGAINMGAAGFIDGSRNAHDRHFHTRAANKSHG